MLVALIANNQNVVVPSVSIGLPTIKIDRGGGGGARWPGYNVVDISAALAVFPEIAGEHPVARAARRMRFLDEALPRIRDTRENREASAFLVGAEIGRRALLAELANEVAAFRAREVPEVPRAPELEEELPRGRRGGGSLWPLAIAGIAIVGAIAIAKRKSRRR
jgi:hypothetical protein